MDAGVIIIFCCSFRMTLSVGSSSSRAALSGYPLAPHSPRAGGATVVETCGRRASVTSSLSMLEKDPLWQAVEAGHGENGALAGVVEEGRKTLRRAS